jgi:hypothetical protein
MEDAFIWRSPVHWSYSPDTHNFEVVQVDFLAVEVNVEMNVEIQRKEPGTEASRRTQTHKVSLVVFVEQLESV